MSGDTVNGIPRVDPHPSVQSSRAIARRLAGWLGTSKSGAAVWRRIGARVEAPIGMVTGGRLTLKVGAPVVVLTSTGARSGRPRQTPLAYFTDGDDVILTASNFGRRRQPGWYYDLLAHPVCELHIGPNGGKFLAREAEGADRERLFALALDIFPAYARYAHTTNTRHIPMLRLTPLPTRGNPITM